MSTWLILLCVIITLQYTNYSDYEYVSFNFLSFSDLIPYS